MFSLFIACSAPTTEASDATLWLRSESASELSAALAPCDAMLGASARGECVAVAGGRLGEDHADEARLACAGLDEQHWRDECYFVLAEARTDALHPEVAWAACKSSGAFRENCYRHLFERLSEHSWRRRDGGQAALLFDRALVGLDTHQDGERMGAAWDVFTTDADRFRVPADPAWCHGLTMAMECRQGMLDEAAGRARQRMTSLGPERQEVCEAEDVVGALGTLDLVMDEGIEDALRSAALSLCS